MEGLRLEDFGFSPPKQPEVLNYADFQNGTFMVVSKIAFLIGVPLRIFENDHEPPKLEWYNKLKADKNARIVRNLCSLRNALEQNYTLIYRAIVNDLKNLNTMPDLIPQESITELSYDGISIVKANQKPAQYIIDINKHINNRINNCKALFPIWLKWDYIKKLFIMPDGLAEAGIKIAAADYYANRNNYPYGVYMNWDYGDYGNILYNDKKFVRLLYESHEDCFSDLKKVTDAGNITKSGIYGFLESSENVAVVVDCENSNPYKLYAMLNNLNQEALLNKICKIILYDDIHTTNAWGILEKFTDIPVEHNVVQRIKEEKSLVDPSLMVGTCREFFLNHIHSFILLSSDSDYWGLISAMPEADFLVMVESEKCGPDIKRALVDSGIKYFYIDDFSTGNSSEIKIEAVLSEVRETIGQALNLNVEEVLDEAIYSTRADLSTAERKQLYNRYIKPMKLEIGSEGEVFIRLGE